MSLYSFSWLQNVETSKKGIKLKNGSYFTLNFYDVKLVKKVLKNILENPDIFAGARVLDVRIEFTPQFKEKEYFFLASPVLVKRNNEYKETHYTYLDEEANAYMTETLKAKAKIAGLNTENLKVYFDKNYHSPKTKIISYKGIQNRVNICPVIIEGSPELIAFAWDVGLGNSTGIGFGALK
ncbi:MAG: CRISPR associated protein Cas6 [Firmicutes bacterium ADurb.Bin419]|nr:MAG: CRISPR associated protein Cas6 [Firmicutes bacterium ADurb.Bin419]